MEPPLKTEFDEWIARIVAFAFSIPPSALVSAGLNRSIAEQHERTAEEEGIEPLKQHLATIFNEILNDHLGYDDLEFVWVEEDEIDQEKQSKILTRYAESAVLTINQIRARLGEEPDPNPAANQLMVKTATGYVPISGPEQPATNTEGDDAAKLAKGGITMLAPADWVYRADQFSLDGICSSTDVRKRERTVFNEEDARALEAAGFTRKSA